MRNPHAAPQGLLSVAQAAAELGWPTRTLHYRIATGKVAAEKVGGGKTSAYVITRAEIERVQAAEAVGS